MVSSNDTKKTANYYSEFSETYDKERSKGYFSFINDLEFEKIQPLTKGKTCLEIGCGTGLILERTHRIATHSIGVDVSEGMLKHCTKKNLNTILIDGHLLPFQEAYFDITYSFKVLPHVQKIKEILSEASRVTKPDGTLILEFYNPFSFKFINDFIKAKLRRKRVYIRYDTLKQFQAYLPDGWELTSVRGIRIFGVAAFCYTLPLLSSLIRWLDRTLCDSRLFSQFGGYCIAEFKRSRTPTCATSENA